MISGRIGTAQDQFIAAMCHVERCLTQVHLPIHVNTGGCRCCLVWERKRSELLPSYYNIHTHTHTLLKYMILSKSNKECSWNPLPKQ